MVSANDHRSARRKAVRAWVVRWEWQGERAAVDQPVAAVLRPQIRARQVMKVMDALYAARMYQPDEMLSMLRRGGHNPYPARLSVHPFEIDGRVHHVPWEGEIVCGHNPWLRARQARAWANDDGTIGWEDDPVPKLKT